MLIPFARTRGVSRHNMTTEPNELSTDYFFPAVNNEKRARLLHLRSLTGENNLLMVLQSAVLKRNHAWYTSAVLIDAYAQKLCRGLIAGR